MSSLTISLFGGLRIARGGRSLEGRLPGRKGRALVAYLVLNHERPVSREELLDVLWPARPPTAPEAAIASLLAKVRAVVGPGVIYGRQALTVRLSGCAVDVQVVAEQTELAEQASVRGDLLGAIETATAVLEIHVATLLPDLDGDWVDAWRRRFELLAIQALELVARAGLALGDEHLAAAERAAAALVQREPFREGGHALLMQAQAQQGNVADALRTFDRVRLFLRDELGSPPSASLLALHEGLLRDGGPAPRPTQPLPLPPATARMVEGALVGRDAVMQALRTLWGECGTGPTRLALLVGEAGVGKTRLCSELAAEVHADGGVVLYGRADEEASLPHQPFVEALRHLLIHDRTLANAAERDREILGRLLPNLAPPGVEQRDDDTLRHRLFEAVTALLCAASRRSPLLLILDDLHWADKPTVLLLRHLLRHPELTDMLVVATLPDVEHGADPALLDLLTDMRRERRLDRLTLAGLDDSATRAFVGDRLGRDVSAAFVERLHAQTRGNAFFIEETLRSLVERGALADDTLTEAALEELGVPEGVAEIVARRVGRLSPLAAATLIVASVVGREFRLAIVAQLVDEAPSQVMRALEECIAAGLVIDDGVSIDEFSFSHALVREVLYSRIGVSRRVRLHQRAGEALEADPGRVSPAELAHHFLCARQLIGLAAARGYVLAAGDHAIRLLAYEEAVEHYRDAVALFEGSDDAERGEVLLALGRAQARAGDDRARSTFARAASSAAARGDADQLARAALGHSARYHESWHAGTRGRELLEEALAALDAGDSVHRALLLSRLAEHAAFATGRPERAMDLSGDALAMARRLGDDNLLLAALMARHATLLHVRHLDERLRLSREFMGLRVGRPELMAERRQWRMYDLLEGDDVEAARAHQPQLEALADEMRQPQWLSIAAGWRGLWAELAGDVGAAERDAEECLEYGRRADMKHALSSWAARLVMLRHRQGRLGELAPAVEQLVRGADMRRTGMRSAFGLILAEAGERDAATAIYRDEFARYTDALPHFWLTNVAMLSELCVGLRDATGARTLYAALSPYAHRNVVIGYGSCWGPVERYLALLAATFGDEEARARHAKAAVGRVRALGAPLLEAELVARHADVL